MFSLEVFQWILSKPAIVQYNAQKNKSCMCGFAIDFSNAPSCDSISDFFAFELLNAPSCDSTSDSFAFDLDFTAFSYSFHMIFDV